MVQGTRAHRRLVPGDGERLREEYPPLVEDIEEWPRVGECQKLEMPLTSLHGNSIRWKPSRTSLGSCERAWKCESRYFLLPLRLRLLTLKRNWSWSQTSSTKARPRWSLIDSATSLIETCCSSSTTTTFFAFRRRTLVRRATDTYCHLYRTKSFWIWNVSRLEARSIFTCFCSLTCQKHHLKRYLIRYFKSIFDSKSRSESMVS